MGVGVDRESSILIALLKDAVGEASSEIDNRKGKLDETTLKLCSEAVDAILPHCKTGVPEVTGARAGALAACTPSDRGGGAVVTHPTKNCQTKEQLL